MIKITEKIKFVKSTPSYLVIEKPSGVLTHPTAKKEPDTLIDQTLKKFPSVAGIGDGEDRPGIVHRLDKEVSGLLVIARTPTMFEHLKKQFKKREVNKVYTALVHGQVESDEGEIDFPIIRSKARGRMAAVPKTKKGIQTDDGKTALTEFFVEKRFRNFSLLTIKIHTGRTHQIRAHMLAYNHPLVGDPLYFKRKQKRKWDDKLGRIFLHSSKLEFKDLDGKKQSFESKLPNKLKDFLSEIK